MGVQGKGGGVTRQGGVDEAHMERHNTVDEPQQGRSSGRRGVKNLGVFKVESIVDDELRDGKRFFLISGMDMAMSQTRGNQKQI